MPRLCHFKTQQTEVNADKVYTIEKLQNLNYKKKKKTSLDLFLSYIRSMYLYVNA